MGLEIDRYDVQRLLGQGAMGKVYLATDPKLGRDVAVKVLSYNTDDPNIRHRFRLEARAVAALKHPNIVELYDYSGENAADLFLVMEFVQGSNLADRIGERGMMPEPTALCICHEICLALEHAHGHKVVHRDLKPENVVMSKGRVVLMDFGVVKAFADGGALGNVTMRTRTQVVGTPGFMAPEQLTGKKVEARTDLFAIGALLYYLVTARAPFDADGIDEIFRRTKKCQFEDPRLANPVLSEGCCEVIQDLLQVRPARRIPTAEKVRARIIDVLKAHGVTEVRNELSSYDENPGKYAIEQRERALEVLTRDLKLAIKDHDEPRVQAIVRRMQLIAPLGEGVKDVTGIRFDSRRGVRLKEHKPPRRLTWFAAGIVAGIVLGAAGATIALLGDLLPPTVMAQLEQLQSALRASLQ